MEAQARLVHPPQAVRPLPQLVMAVMYYVGVSAMVHAARVQPM